MTSRDSGDEVRWRMEMWKASVEKAQSITILLVRRYAVRSISEGFIRKNIYWKTMGCCARRRK